MKFVKIFLMFLAISVLIVPISRCIEGKNPLGVKLTPLSENEKSSLIGALWCHKCPSSPNKTCPGLGSCSGVTCIQYILDVPGGMLTPIGCGTSGGSRGCTSSGSYKRCVWAWGSSCSNSNARCGSSHYPKCNTNAAGTVCTGTCSMKTGGTCKYGC